MPTEEKTFSTIEDERYYYEHEATEKEWSDWYQNVEKPRYNHPDVTIDCVMVTFDENERIPKNTLKVLIIKRFTHPFKGKWTLPGTFLHSDETANTAIARMLVSRLDFHTKGNAIVQQLQTFTGPNRDPRGQIVSIANIVYVRNGVNIIKNIDGVEWAPIGEILDEHLAFDHDEIIDVAVERMRVQFGWTPHIFYTLPAEFTLSDAMKLRGSLFQSDWTKIKRGNFRAKFSPLWNEIGVVDPKDPTSAKLYEYKG